ncbi:MAG: PEP-CTERM sorting domain-containing protein [Planctomycetales bacterium]|nr:PEP-CTERM sorting domain-containing protein [Planctomycetales bacterium]
MILQRGGSTLQRLLTSRSTAGDRRSRRCIHALRPEVEVLEARQLLVGDVAGIAFLDVNGDGIQDAEDTGQAAVNLRLMSVGGDGAIGGGDDVQQAAMNSGADGAFAFTGIDAGMYYLAAVPPRGLGVSPQDAAGDDATDSDFDPLTARTEAFALADDATVTLDAGFFARNAPAHVFDNVPEASEFEILYSLDVTNTAAYNTNGVPYSLDRGSGFAREIDRVAYYLELVPGDGGPLQYAYVSMDPFTSNAGLLGVPHTAAAFQQTIVANMNVVSNVPGVVNGEGIATGNIEFWNSNYREANSASVPGADDGTYDFGDEPSAGNYGSMQIHNHGEGQTILAYNNWGGSTGELGIGNQPVDSPDWTFSRNAGSYTIKTLQVLVRPTGGAGGEITGRIFQDDDADGLERGDEPSVANVVVRLMSPGGDGQPGGGDDTSIAQVTTDAAGAYRFEGAPAGSYFVAADRPRGQLWTEQDVGGDDAIDNDLNANGNSAVFTIADGETIADVDGGLVDLASHIGLLDNVPEAADYELIYSLEIQNAAAYNNNGVPYSIDNSNTFTDTFDRIAYYLELEPLGGGDPQYAYVSMDAYTRDVEIIGVPNTAAGFQQRNVANMNVVSNVAGVVNGEGIETGNIEFWNLNYGRPNVTGVPNASDGAYDFGDEVSTGGTYGSMQIHNYGESQTIFAYNNWGGGAGEAGIGNQPTGEPDWTFSSNIASYGLKSLHVLVRPGPEADIEVIVPEAAEYEVIYALDIGETSNYDALPGGIPDYAIDNSATFTDTFDRVAYFLELKPANGGPMQYAYVSMSAFTDDVSLLGVPTTATGAVFQQNVSDMNVFSNVGGVVTGERITTGNIEFWGSNYGPANGNGVPGASDSTFDFGDTRSAGNHGSMQIHNHGAGQTLFALNNWNTGAGSALGIGTNPSGQPDWTFVNNSSTYTLRHLEVLVIATPEPSTMLLCGMGLVGLVVRRGRGAAQRVARSSAAVACVAMCLLVGQAQADVFTNVGEANYFQTLYSLDIPDNPDFDTNGISYAADFSSQFAGKNLYRVAYYLELDNGGGSQWVYVSVDPFTQNVNHLGVPTFASGAIHQQILSNMNVVSNVGSIVQGTGIETGNIEFWPTNYSNANGLPIPGASGTAFDFGDTRVAAGVFGSMQIHNHGAGQTLFAFNDWNDTSNAALGIGNNPSGEPDWTFVTNSATYTLKHLDVLVQVIPEPSTALLCGLGLVGLVARRRKGCAFARVQNGVNSSLLRRSANSEARLAIGLLSTVIVIAALSSNGEAAIIETPVSNGSNHAAFDASVSAADLVNTGSTALLSATTSSINFGPVGHNNGVAASDTTNATFFDNTRLPGTITYTLDTSVKFYGYDITQIQSIAGWVSNSTTHANQDYDIEVSYINSPVFTPLTTVTYLPFNGTPTNANKSSMVSLTDDTGRIATGVDQLRFTFRQTGAWGTSAGFVLREIDVFGTASVAPEPSTALLILGGLIGLVQRRSRTAMWRK